MSLLFNDKRGKDGTFYAVRAVKGWYRGAKFWRWTRFLSCAGLIDDRDFLSYWIVPDVLERVDACQIVKVVQKDGTTTFTHEENFTRESIKNKDREFGDKPYRKLDMFDE